jgi:serine/threonine protein kinase
MNDKVYSYASDVYSLGVLIYELQHLYRTDMERVISIQKLRQARGVECLYFKNLIMEMTETDPLKRPSVSMIRNQFFINIKDPIVMCRDIVWELISSVLEKYVGGCLQQN